MALFKSATPFETTQKLLREMPWLWAANQHWWNQKIHISRIGMDNGNFSFMDHSISSDCVAVWFKYGDEKSYERTKQIEIPNPRLVNGRELAMWDLLNDNCGSIAVEDITDILGIFRSDVSDHPSQLRFVVFRPEKDASFYCLWRNSWRRRENEVNNRARRRQENAVK